jgi:hypothetical protein
VWSSRIAMRSPPRPALRSTPHGAGQIAHPELCLSRWVAGDRASDSPTPTISPTSGVGANGHELGNATAERRSTAPRCRGRCDPRRRGLRRRSPSASHRVREPDPHAAAIAGASPKKRNRKRVRRRCEVSEAFQVVPALAVSAESTPLSRWSPIERPLVRSGQVRRMLGTRVVFVDGLPGSGKSMTAEYIATELEQRGIPCRLLRERETNHPLNVGGDLHPSGSTTGARMFAEYSVGSFVEESLARWNAFVTQAMNSERVNVLDSYPFQNSLRVLLQMDADPVTLAAYQSSVEEAAAGLDPVLIYLDPGDTERTLRAIAEQRGPAWTDYAIAVVTECPYASSRGLQGLDGAVAILRSYKHLLDEAVARFPFPRLVLSDCHRRWQDCHAKIREFLRFESGRTAVPSA